jgi:rhamnosyltransferase
MPNNEQPPRIAVLMAAYNGKEWLNEQVESILKQEGVDVTLYISVDQSSDSTEELVNSLAINDTRIQVLPHGLRFGGAAPNFYHLIKSVDFSQYDFVALSDQDDIWSKDKLARASSSIETGNWDAYSSNVTAFWPDGKMQLIHKAQAQVQWDFLFEAAGPGCTYVLNKSLATHLQEFIRGGWHEVQTIDLHDWMIYAFARANNYRWKIDSISGLLYRQHMKNQVGANVGMRAIFSRFKKITSGWWLDQALQIAMLLHLQNQSFVKSWSDRTRFGYLSLSFHSCQCRRRLRDKFLFLFLNLYLAIFKPPIANNYQASLDE